MDVGEDIGIPDDFSDQDLISGMWWRHLVAGGWAGAVSRTCTAPLDRLKIMLQVHGGRKSLSIKDAFSYMIREGGWRGLWRGNGMNVIKIAPESALKFAAYDFFKRLIRGDADRDLNLSERFCAGSMAGGVSQTVIYPMEVMKTRLALRKTNEFNGIFDCAKKLYKHGGVTVFYRGYIPNLLGILPYAGIDLAVYETLKQKYLSRYGAKGDQVPPAFTLLACGTFSSCCGQVAAYPLALVRTKLQSQGQYLDSIGVPNREYCQQKTKKCPSYCAFFRLLSRFQKVNELKFGVKKGALYGQETSFSNPTWMPWQYSRFGTLEFDLSFGQLRFSVVIFQLVLTSTYPENRHTASVFSVTFSGLKVCVAFIVGSCPTSAKWPRLSPSPITFTSERDNI